MPRMAALAGLAAQFVSAPEFTDAELIGRFVRHRDEAAFAAVVRRHGRSVHGVCRRILGNATDADDAFQAAFLVLAKKAHRVAFHSDVSAWLFAVAVRASRELLRRRTRRANRESTGTVPERETTDHFDFEAGRIVLDEVAKLSESYRSAVVLCELEGLGRSEAAHRLGIAEGTLSSRLAAARKLLAARLAARGVTLAALAPLGGFVPPMLAATVASLAVSSDVPSQTVSELMEVLMRTGITLSARKWVAALGVLAAVVGGFTLGEDPKPQPIQPAAAKVVEQDEPQSKLILTFREEVRYLTPDGKEIQRIDYELAKKADPNLETGAIVIGTNGIELTRYLPHCGRPGPGGVLPLESTGGLKLMTPGHPPKVKLLDATPHSDRVAGWSPDGKSFVSYTSESNALVADYAFTTYRVDAASGAREKLPVGSEHCVIDISADGKRFLTQRKKSLLLVLSGFADGIHDICVIDERGKIQRERSASNAKFDTSGHRLSPDGSKIAEVARPKEKEPRGPLLAIAAISDKDGIAGRPFRYVPSDGSKVECRAVAWSPDGKRVVSLWTPMSWKDKQTWTVVECDLNGESMRKVVAFETKGDEQIRSLDWR